MEPVRDDAPPIREVLRAGPIELRIDEGTVLAQGRPVPLTVREVGVLAALLRRTDHVVGRDALYASVWNGRLADGDRSVDVYVSRLRAKLARALPGWSYIHTHFGFGYRFSPRAESDLHDFHTSLTER